TCLVRQNALRAPMGNELCPCRKRFVQPCTTSSDPVHIVGEVVCAVSPRNRLHVWDTPGVSLPCASCDDLLFTNPLELAAGLLDALAALESPGSQDAAKEQESGYAISARITSAVCVGAAMATDQHDRLPEVVYTKVQHVLSLLRPFDPLQELQMATLLHARFLLELCFGCSQPGTPPIPAAVSRMAVRMFSAMHAAGAHTIWGILEEIKSCKMRNWHHRDTPEGHRLQVSCAVLQIYGLTSLLARSSRTVDTFNLSVDAALEEISSAARASTCTESQQVCSFRAIKPKAQKEGLETAPLEARWLVSWMLLHSAGTLFSPKPCNGGQTAIQAWAVKQASELALSQCGAEMTAVITLRAASLLIIWRGKLAEIFEEDLLVSVNTALSAASGQSIVQGTESCKLVMLLEKPSLILGSSTVPCLLHMGAKNVICVPGMSADNQDAGLEGLLQHQNEDQAGEIDGGLSPDELPVEFLLHDGRDEAPNKSPTLTSMVYSWKLQEPSTASRPEAISTIANLTTGHVRSAPWHACRGGRYTHGNHDAQLASSTFQGIQPQLPCRAHLKIRTLAAAKVRCTSLPNCMGFCCEDLLPGEWGDRAVDVHFKVGWSLVPIPSGRAIAYQKERASPVFTRHYGYSLDGDDLLVAEMTIEAAKRACVGLKDCMGFTLEGNPMEDVALVYFKTGTQLLPVATEVQTSYVFQVGSRSHALPADGETFFDLVRDGTDAPKDFHSIAAALLPADTGCAEPLRIFSGTQSRWPSVGSP
ncbi:unnamed protein product, partial [Effrenium voratum]